MSNFLGFESFLVPLGAAITDVQTTFENALTSRSLQIKRRGKAPLAILGTFPTPSSHFDMNPTTSNGLTAASGLPLWSGFQAPSAFTPTRLTIKGPISVSGGPAAAPKNFTLDFSDNGTAWTTLQSFTNESNWANGEDRSWDVVGAGAHAYWRIYVTANNGSGYVELVEISLVDATGNHITSNLYTDFIPPASEAIGDGNSMDVIRMEFGANYLRLRGVQYLTAAQPQVVYIQSKTGGAVQGSVTINGVTVTGALALSTDTPQKVLRNLYEAIRASSDPNFTAWTWEYQKAPAQNASDSADYIYGISNTPGASNIAITSNANVNANTLFSSGDIGPTGTPTAAATASLTTDLVNGFIYYLQVNARGIAIATKTNSAYYGPVHACYAEYTKALAAVPSGGWKLPCTIIELMVGYDGPSTSIDAYARMTHAWGMLEATYGSTAYTSDGSGGSFWTPWGKCGGARGKIFDAFLTPGGSPDILQSLYGSNLFFTSGLANVGNDFQIHRCSPIAEYTNANPFGPMTGYQALFAPILDIQDWYRFVGTATDEALLMVSDTVAVSPLSANIGTTDTSIGITSTAGFQASGFVVIESEIIQYSGISGNTLTGCTRGKYGTTATSHFAGDQVGQGLWFVKINGGALFCGYQKPA